MTRAALAQQLDVSWITIHRWINVGDTRRMSGAIIADVLGVPAVIFTAGYHLKLAVLDADGNVIRAEDVHG